MLLLLNYYLFISYGKYIRRDKRLEICERTVYSPILTLNLPVWTPLTLLWGDSIDHVCSGNVPNAKKQEVVL